MNQPTHVIIHCSDSAWGCAREINKWHIQRGFTSIGYHFVIMNGNPEIGKHIEELNGAIECGRAMTEIGAHCLGYNERSLGVCLVLKDKPTIEQLDALKYLLIDLCHQYGIPAENVLGHCETDSGKSEGKTCPNFDVAPIRMYLGPRI